MSQGGSSRKKAPILKCTNKCHACEDIGYYVECTDLKSKTETAKVVHKEVIDSISFNEDPKTRRGEWYLGSKCTVHVCNSRDMFVDYEAWSGYEVVLDNNEHADVAGIGTVVLGFATGKVLTLSNVFHIPTVGKCLVSLHKLAEIGCKISSEAGTLVIKRNHEIVGRGYLQGGMYWLSTNEDIKTDTKVKKVVHNERISLIIANPVLIQERRRGWYLVTGTTVHVCNSRDMFVDYQPLINHEVPIVLSNNNAEVAGIGTVVLQLSTGKVLTLPNVLHVPVLIKCLISACKLCELGYKVYLGCENIIKNMDDDEVVGEAFIEDGLIRLSVVEDNVGGTNE